MVDLGAPLDGVVGANTAKALREGLGLSTVADLLRHYPRRYARRGELTPLASTPLGEHVTVLAEIRRCDLVPMRSRRGRRLDVVITDRSGSMRLTFFNQDWRRKQLLPGRQGLFAGKVSEYRGSRQLTHPDYVLLDDEGGAAEEFTRLIPVYPAAASVASWAVARAVRVVLDVADLEDPLPPAARLRHGLLGLRDALLAVHRPESLDDVESGRSRLAWDEAFTLQVVLAQRRAAAGREAAVARPGRADGLLAAFDGRLPYRLTAGQRAVSEEIFTDLAGGHPMHRLLQGEVGSGKTVVALRAMLRVVDAGGQAALLAPTEVLAQQHHRSIRDLLGPLGAAGELGATEDATQVVLLTGSTPAATRRRALDALAEGGAGIVVGTHALLEESVRFADLGLVVIDEQHRFGVEQRAVLRDKAPTRPHVLVMTATPIPRTVAMTVYGDLETSLLTELPGGRAGTRTSVVPADRAAWLRRAWERVREEVAAGHQCYVVCPRIQPGTPDDGARDAAGADAAAGGGEDVAPAGQRVAAVEEVLPFLREGPLAGLRVEGLHGRLGADTKDDLMRRFAAGLVDVLVATTVIEVGVDVANATVMVVLDADRFGASQLHQLRGRVGRGADPGLCLLVTSAPDGSPARERLDAVAATADGFAVARLDLEQRREGDVLGSAQSGRRSSLRLLSLLRDEEVIRAARDAAADVVSADPRLARHPALARAVAALDEERAEFLEKT